jgi:hypothetical protein
VTEHGPERISLLGAHLHLGPAAGGTKATVEGAAMQAVLAGRACYVWSPRPEEILEEAVRQGAPAQLVRTAQGSTVVRFAPPPADRKVSP